MPTTISGTQAKLFDIYFFQLYNPAKFRINKNNVKPLMDIKRLN
jgi:hypothetical protein